MSGETAARGGGGNSGGGSKVRLTLLVIFLIALIGGGYLTYRDLVTPFAPMQVTVVGPDADVSSRPEPGAKEAQPRNSAARSAPQPEQAAGTPETGAAPADAAAPSDDAAAADAAAPAPGEIAAVRQEDSDAGAASDGGTGAAAEAGAARDATAPAEQAGATGERRLPPEAEPDGAAGSATAPRAGSDGAGDRVSAPAPDAGTQATLPQDESVPSLSVQTVRTPQPEAGADPAQQPTFDVIRIDSTGSGLVAGRAPPGSTVQIMSGDSVIATAETSKGGEFVAFIQTPGADEGQVLSLAANGTVAGGGEDLLILPSPEAGEEPTVVKANDDEVRILQPSPLGRVDGVTLDSISYDEGGAVQLAGRAPGAQAIRIYADGAPVALTRSSDAGTWDARLDSVEAGRYVLRVDALAEDGTVESRAESPFQRVYPPAGETSGPTQITVQPGNTLWVMAREKYGSGMLYTQIFAANNEAIRDPNLIYPGQIFTLPAGEEVQR